MKETADKMAAKGRGSDNVIAHLTGGEVVVPVEILNEFPTLRKSLSNAFENMGLNPAQYVAGHGENSINPETGAPEFIVHDKIVLFFYLDRIYFVKRHALPQAT